MDYLKTKMIVYAFSSLTDRFRALFTLKNLGGEQAIDFIAKGQ